MAVCCDVERVASMTRRARDERREAIELNPDEVYRECEKSDAAGGSSFASPRCGSSGPASDTAHPCSSSVAPPA